MFLSEMVCEPNLNHSVAFLFLHEKVVATLTATPHPCNHFTCDDVPSHFSLFH